MRISDWSSDVCSSDLGGLERGHAERLPRLQPITRRRAVAVHPKLAGARPFGDHGIGRLGHMALEPAIEPDAVVVGRYPELADLVGAPATPRASASPPNSARPQPIPDPQPGKAQGRGR